MAKDQKLFSESVQSTSSSTRNSSTSCIGKRERERVGYGSACVNLGPVVCVWSDSSSRNYSRPVCIPLKLRLDKVDLSM